MYSKILGQVHNSKQKTVHFFVDNLSTSFVKNELLSKVNVYVLQVPQGDVFPVNINIHKVVLPQGKSSLLGKHFFSIMYLFTLEFFKYPAYIFNMALLRMQFSVLVKSFSVFNYLKSNSAVSKDDVFYSFWMNDWAITLSILKKKGVIKAFSSRVHGADLFEERVPKIGRLPFRWFVLKNIDQVFSVSKTGLEYLKGKYPIHAPKFSCFYLGTADHGINFFDNTSIFTVVSCAHVRNIKRVYLIAEYLKEINFPLKWIHIGAEQKYDKTYPRYLKAIEDLKNKNNIKVELLGDLSQEKVFDLYSSVSINLFLSLSSTEGLPVSMMEAISFGIPLLATDVGGCKEIANKETGKLLNSDVSVEEFAKSIEEFKNSEMNSNTFRICVRKFWEENFNDQINYSKFFEAISLA
jgi:glycosyltransferase involved in cell wall biosynthesis